MKRGTGKIRFLFFTSYSNKPKNFSEKAATVPVQPYKEVKRQTQSFKHQPADAQNASAESSLHQPKKISENPGHNKKSTV